MSYDHNYCTCCSSSPCKCTDKYVRITLQGGRSYIQPKTEIPNAVSGELDCLESERKITLTFEAIQMTDEEYSKLSEFTGH